MPRLSMLAMAGLALLDSAEAFAPRGGAWLQTKSRSSLCLDAALLPSSARHGGAIAGPTMLLDDSCSPSKRRSNNHKHPSLGFKPSFSTAGHVLKDEDVRKEVLENTVDNFVASPYDHSLYTSISHTSQAIAHHLPTLNKLAKSLPSSIDLPPGAGDVAHKLLHAAAFTPWALPVVGAAFFYAAFLVEANDDEAALQRAGRDRVPERQPREDSDTRVVEAVPRFPRGKAFP